MMVYQLPWKRKSIKIIRVLYLNYASCPVGKMISAVWRKVAGSAMVLRCLASHKGGVVRRTVQMFGLIR